MDVEGIGKRIRELRKKHKWTQKELGKKVHVSSQVVSNWERGYTTTLEPFHVSRLADVFEVSVDYLLGRISDPSPVIKELPSSYIPDQTDMIELPVLGTIRAGEPIDRIENYMGMYPAQFDKVRGKDAFWLHVKGESMAGDEIHDGDLVLVVVTPEVTPSDIAVVSVDQEEATLKRVKCQGDICMLIPSNKDMEPKIYPAKKIHIIGKVIGFQRYW